MTNHITAIVYGNKKINYTKKEIQKMIDNIDVYQCADNLPKWLFASGQCKSSTRSITKCLKKLIAGEKQTIDVRY